MIVNYKRKTIKLLCFGIAFFCCCLCFFGGCNSGEEKDKSNLKINNGIFSVYFIDVGEGDATLFCFPDGKTMLIDSGDCFDYALDNVSKLIRASGSKLDYLVVTHPDSDHTANIENLLKEFSLKTAYIPYIENVERFTVYNKAYTAIKNSAENIKYSQTGEYIVSEDGDYKIAFLSPYQKENSKSSYNAINENISPTADEINDVSPIIYIEYKGVRIVMTGDAGEKQEKFVIDDYKSNYIKWTFEDSGIDVNLDAVDILKVSHHGGDDASSSYFLDVLTPLNAVMSVGSGNIYSHPSSSVIDRIYNSNQNSLLWRTDVSGTIVASISFQGNLSVQPFAL